MPVKYRILKITYQSYGSACELMYCYVQRRWFGFLWLSIHCGYTDEVGAHQMIEREIRDKGRPKRDVIYPHLR